MAKEAGIGAQAEEQVLCLLFRGLSAHCLDEKQYHRGNGRRIVVDIYGIAYGRSRSVMIDESDRHFWQGFGYGTDPLQARAVKNYGRGALGRPLGRNFDRKTTLIRHDFGP